MSENNNLPHFSYRYCRLGKSNPYLWPNFWISEFPCFTHVFEIHILGKLKRISKIWERFFLKTNQYTKTLFILYTSVTYLKDQIHLWAPFFQQFGQNFRAVQATKIGILLWKGIILKRWFWATGESFYNIIGGFCS